MIDQLQLPSSVIFETGWTSKPEVSPGMRDAIAGGERRDNRGRKSTKREMAKREVEGMEEERREKRRQG